MLKKFIAITCASLLLFTISCETRAPIEEPQTGNTLNIVASNKMVEQMIRLISGDLHNITTIVEEESLIESYKAEDIIIEDENVNLFFHFGAGYEPFSEKLSESFNKNRVSVINISRGVGLLEYRDRVTNRSVVNPYYLSSPRNYLTAISNVANGLIEKDPFRSYEYNANLMEVKHKIESFVRAIEESNINNNDIVYIAATNELRYLLNSFDVKYITAEDHFKDFMNNNGEHIYNDYIFIYADDEDYEANRNIMDFIKAVPLKVTLMDYENTQDVVYFSNLIRFKGAVNEIFLRNQDKMNELY